MAQLTPGSSLLAKSSPGSLTRRKEEEKRKSAIPETEGAVGSLGREFLEMPAERKVAPGSNKVLSIRPSLDAGGASGVMEGIPTSTPGAPTAEGPSVVRQNEIAAQKKYESDLADYNKEMENYQNEVRDWGNRAQEVYNEARKPQRAWSPYNEEIDRRKARGETLSTSRKLAGAIRKREEFLRGERVINNPSGDTGKVGKIYGPKIDGQERVILDVPGFDGSISFEGSDPMEFYEFITGEDIPGVEVDLAGRVGRPPQKPSGEKPSSPAAPVQGAMRSFDAERPQAPVRSQGGREEVAGARSSIKAMPSDTLRDLQRALPTANQAGGRVIAGPEDKIVYMGRDLSEQEENALKEPLRERISREGLRSFIEATARDPLGGLLGLGERGEKTIENLINRDRNSYQERLFRESNPRRIMRGFRSFFS